MQKIIRYDKDFNELARWIDSMVEGITELKGECEEHSKAEMYNAGYLKALEDVKLRFCYD